MQASPKVSSSAISAATPGISSASSVSPEVSSSAISAATPGISSASLASTEVSSTASQAASPARIFELALVQVEVPRCHGGQLVSRRLFVTKEELARHGGLKAYCAKVKGGRVCAEPLAIRANVGEMVEMRVEILLPGQYGGSLARIRDISDVICFPSRPGLLSGSQEAGILCGQSGLAPIAGSVFAGCFSAGPSPGALLFLDCLEKSYGDVHCVETGRPCAFPASESQGSQYGGLWRTAAFPGHLGTDSPPTAAVGALIVEEAGASFHHIRTGNGLRYGTKAAIQREDGSSFREYVLFVHNPAQHALERVSEGVSISKGTYVENASRPKGCMTEAASPAGKGAAGAVSRFGGREAEAAFTTGHRAAGAVPRSGGREAETTFTTGHRAAGADSPSRKRESEAIFTTGHRTEGAVPPPGVCAAEVNFHAEPMCDRLAKADDPAYAFSSLVHGDPATPILESYPGDEAVIHLLGSKREDGDLLFSMPGMPWREGAGPKEPSRQAGMPLADDISIQIAGAYPPGDYLYLPAGNAAAWDGLWGIFRVHGRHKKRIKPLRDIKTCPSLPYVGKPARFRRAGESRPTAAQGFTRAINPTHLAGSTAAQGGIRRYEAAAIRRSACWYRKRHSDGLFFVPLKDAGRAAKSFFPPKPLILRAAAGEWIELTLHNLIGPGQPIPDDYTDTPSLRVSLNPGRLGYDPVLSSGINVGYNEREQTVATGQHITYLWHADKGCGTFFFQSFGDVREIGMGVPVSRFPGSVPNPPCRGKYGAVVVAPLTDVPAGRPQKKKPPSPKKPGKP